ncbi:MAG TPA: hypothetical protein VG841_08755 [Caulobacterales bacterium]|nr:hypothetical protein [Caulobacterales bacterium]
MLDDRGPAGFFSTWPATSPRPEAETRAEEIRSNIIAVSRRAAPQRALPEAKGESLTAIGVAIMVGMPEPWNAEGPLRAGFRARLCLEGWRWDDADNAADVVVQQALRQSGCDQRPTWEMGQPGYTGWASLTERERCAECAAPIPDSRSGGTKGRAAVLYCSDRCANTACARRARQHLKTSTRAEYLARCAARSEIALAAEIDCEQCGEAFRAGYDAVRRRFCSKACADAGKGRRSKFLAEAVCASCRGSFQPHTRGQKYCSTACYHDMRIRAANGWRGVERQCEACSTIFRVHSAAKPQRTCSRSCAWVLRRREAPQSDTVALSSDARAA